MNMIYLHLLKQYLRLPPRSSKMIIIAQTVHHLLIWENLNQVCVRICNLGNCGKQALHRIAVVSISSEIAEAHPLNHYLIEYMLSGARKETTSAAGLPYQKYEDIMQKVNIHTHTRSFVFTHNMVIGFFYWPIVSERPFTTSFSACTFYYTDHGECRL